MRSLAVVALVLLALFPALLAGCGDTSSAGPSGGPPGGPGGPGGRGPRAGGPGGQLAAEASGAEIYGQKCRNCHGDAGQGATGPSLASAKGMPADQVAGIVRDGKGRMPAFGGQLSPAQLQRLVEHVRSM